MTETLVRPKRTRSTRSRSTRGNNSPPTIKRANTTRIRGTRGKGAREEVYEENYIEDDYEDVVEEVVEKRYIRPMQFVFAVVLAFVISVGAFALLMGGERNPEAHAKDGEVVRPSSTNTGILRGK